MRVVIAEDAVLLREGLARLLPDHGFQVLATVDTGPDLLDAIEREAPDVAIVDVRMPPTFTDEGIRAALTARTRFPATGVLILSQYVEERYARELLGEGTGGVGYLLKERVADIADFIDALRRVGTGGTALDPEVIAQFLGRRRRNALDELSPRELDVLSLVAEGLSNTAIARRLVVTDGAVEKHIRAIFIKLRLPPDGDAHRRVLATLTYLGG